MSNEPDSLQERAWAVLARFVERQCITYSERILLTDTLGDTIREIERLQAQVAVRDRALDLMAIIATNDECPWGAFGECKRDQNCPPTADMQRLCWVPYCVEQALAELDKEAKTDE